MSQYDFNFLHNYLQTKSAHQNIDVINFVELIPELYIELSKNSKTQVHSAILTLCL